MKEFLKRLAVTIIGVPLGLLAVYKGGIIFTAVISAFSAVILWEYYSLSELKGAKTYKITGIIFGILFQFAFFILASNQLIPGYGFLLIPGLILFALYILTLELFDGREGAIVNSAVNLSGQLYITLFMLCLIAIREMHNFKAINLSATSVLSGMNANWGANFLTAILVTIWLGDSAAYIIGSAIGKHKIMPSVSPKKSWEGSIACFIFSIPTFYLMLLWLIPSFPAIHSLILGAVIGIVGQVGDLAESHLKRDAGVKDSSHIIPGHGGMLDRFDSILFVMPVAYIYIILSGFFI